MRFIKNFLSGKKMTEQSEQNSWQRFAEFFCSADAVLVGAGAGLSLAAGYSLSGERFKEHFSDFEEKYGIKDMYSGGFYSFPTPEEYWAYWSRHIWLDRYAEEKSPLYCELLELLAGKNYFVLTTNVDHHFQRAGFDKSRLFYMQGDFGLWQCAFACHRKTYDNRAQIEKMVREQKDMRIPGSLVPRCPRCGKPMAMNLRMDNFFVEDDGWNRANENYQNFLEENAGKKVCYLELGVGANTPMIIKYPFWAQTAHNPNSLYVSVNREFWQVPEEIKGRALDFNTDIAEFIKKAKTVI